MTLKQKMISGALWSLLEKGGQQIISFVVFLFLARILGPEDYGLANICFIFFTLTTMICSGLVDGIVSKQVENPRQISSLFWIVIVIGILISFSCVIFAKPLSNLMSEPKLEQILIWFSIAPALVSAYSIPNVLLLKELDFKIYAIRSLISTTLGGVVGILMAINNYGAYAIVGQQITVYTINNLIVWYSIIWRPSFYFCKRDIKELIIPGLSVMGSNVLGFLDNQTPRLLIGIILGPISLGYYALATRLKFSLSEILVNSPFSVIYPSLAKLGNNRDKQTRLAILGVYFSSLIVFPILAVIISTAPKLIPLVFSETWKEGTLIIQIYLSLLFFYPLQNIVKQLYRAFNMMHLYIQYNLYFILINIASSLLLFLESGLILMGIFLIMSNAISVYFYLKRLNKNTKLNFFSLLNQLWALVTSTTIVFLVIYMWHSLIKLDLHPWTEIIIDTFNGIVVFYIFSYLLNKDKIKQIYAHIISIRN